MCLFLQSQDFQRHTEHMINSLYSSAQHADEHLQHINSNLQNSLDTMSEMGSSLSDVAAAQHQQQQLARENLQGVQQLHADAQNVQTHLSHVLQNEASTSSLAKVWCLVSDTTWQTTMRCVLPATVGVQHCSHGF